MTDRAIRQGRTIMVAVALHALAVCGDAPASTDLAVLHAFDGTAGAWSRGSLTRDGGTLYGRTSIGGAANSGTIFRIGTDGSGFAVLHSFTAGGDNGSGNQPHHNAMLPLGGELIGAALYGGNEHGDVADRVTGDVTFGPPTVKSGNGTIFAIGRDGRGYRVVLELGGGPAASALPHSPPALAPDGRTLYGMTSSGGANGAGTLYVVGTDGSGYRLLHSFEERDGDEPHGMVSFDSRGNLLGMTRKGGTPAAGRGGGVIFHFDLASSAYRVLHSFAAGQRDDGDTNDHGYLALVDGVAYATTELGGARLAGTLFAIGEDGTAFEILHSFGDGPDDGQKPYGSLLHRDGWPYGTTTAGGRHGDGTVFRLRIADRRYEVLASFDRRTTGAFPEDDLVTSADGRTLYGLTQAGGANDPDATRYLGTVFRLAVPAAD